jgi:hypothetical protein
VERSWERRGGGVTLSCHDAEGGMSGRSERRGESAGPDRCRTLDAASAAASSPGCRAEMPATVIVKPRATDHRSHRVPIGSSSVASLGEEETGSDTPLFRGGLNSARRRSLGPFLTSQPLSCRTLRVVAGAPPTPAAHTLAVYR